MMEKLYDMGILSQTTKLSEVERKVGVSKLARRRLGVVMSMHLRFRWDDMAYMADFLKLDLGWRTM